MLAASTPGNVPILDDDSGASLLFMALFGIGVLGLAGLSVGALTMWSRRQDDIGNMMSFCIKSLLSTKDDQGRCEAARALGRMHDPSALLVLVDVINDEKVEEPVHQAALGALGEMSRSYGKYKEVIDALIAAIRIRDHRKVVDTLISNFEGTGGKYTQSSYVIGREFMRLGQYEDARKWLQQAGFRNRTSMLYGGQIRKLADRCNQYLFDEGDRLFKVGDYHKSNERYACSSAGITDEENRRFAAFLRMACVYCKLGDYVNADQAVLQALQHHHETDMSLVLNRLLQKLLHNEDQKVGAEGEREQLKKEIDNLVTEIMAKLCPEDTGAIVNEVSQSSRSVP
ncbi:MAG: HEAT repeat domain-containing protein [Gammaproteobacteria bacterium]|nr:HEAT repeat domain-containing protein [Gammaproteobacteria bacterium]